MAAEAAVGGRQPLPELGSVYWRPVVSDRTLRRSGRLWTLSAAAHTIPLLAAAVGLAVLNPITIPVGLILIVHAWVIPELYAARGAGVVRRRRSITSGPELVALGLLGDLVAHDARAFLGRSGLVIERGKLGVWLVAEAGALLVRPGARRVNCYCVRTTDPDLPPADRISHLLLALRADETGFATVANMAFSGAPWRLRRRLPPERREALAVAVREARTLRS
ncbi:MAG TPA: hypothetical protein VGI87_12625 [Solirubrobacteraceae bacterium]|jgi:hypothetical protein